MNHTSKFKWHGPFTSAHERSYVGVATAMRWPTSGMEVIVMAPTQEELAAICDQMGMVEYDATKAHEAVLTPKAKVTPVERPKLKTVV